MATHTVNTRAAACSHLIMNVGFFMLVLSILNALSLAEDHPFFSLFLVPMGILWIVSDFCDDGFSQKHLRQAMKFLLFLLAYALIWIILNAIIGGLLIANNLILRESIFTLLSTGLRVIFFLGIVMQFVAAREAWHGRSFCYPFTLSKKWTVDGE